jgi:hypothetical protein
MAALHIFYALPFVLMIIPAAISLCQTRFLRIFFSSLFIIATIFSLRVNFLSLIDRRAHLWTPLGSEVRQNIALDVLKWLKKNNIKSIGLGDFGMRGSLAYLNGSEAEIDDIFYAKQFTRSREVEENVLRKRLRNEREGYYLFRRYPWVPYFNDFAKIAKEENKNIVIAEEFKAHEPDGETVFILYKVSGTILNKN